MMEMNDLHKHILLLSEKVDRLIAQNQRLKKELSECQSEKSLDSEKLASRPASEDSFLNQIKLAKIVGSNSVESSDAAALKQLVSAYIKEIDHCLAQLSE
jgi:hypothetical protein